MRSRHDPRRSFRPLLEALEARALLSVCTVDRLTDVGEGKGMAGDLRYCIEQAQDGDNIQFGITGFIGLTHALPNLTRSISIEGPGASLLFVVPVKGGDYRIVTVAEDATVALSGLTIGGGRTAVGGGIYNAGLLTLNNIVLFGNRAGGTSGDGEGGGLYNTGVLTVSDSIIGENSAGGIFGGGGGIFNLGTMDIRNSTLARNGAGGLVGVGGGIFNFGIVTISDSTLSGNVAFGEFSGIGGGIANVGTLTVINSTITDNQAAGVNISSAGGGLYNEGEGILNLRNTILAGNTSRNGPDLSGSLTSSSYNLIGNTQGGSGFDKTDLLDIDPLLGPLRDNGGPTLTHALLPGSLALNAGDPTDAPEWDQRGEGFYRIVGKNIDIGAYEEQGGRSPAPGAALPPRFVITVGIDPGALMFLETPTRRTFFGGGAEWHS